MASRVKVVIAVVVVGLVAAAAGLWWYLRDDVPDEVDLASAVASVEDTEPTSATDTDGSNDATDAGVSGPPEATDPPAGVEGTWTVDTDSGEFDFESATGTFVGFRIQEELTLGSTTAVGRTGDVSGSITIDGTTLTEAHFEVDLTTITTDRDMRDSRVQGALDTTRFPTATFTLAGPVELGAGAADGAPVAVTVQGELTIHGVTRPVEIPLEAQLVADTVVVVGSVDITFADYGVEVPSAPIVVSADDHGLLELQILLTR